MELETRTVNGQLWYPRNKEEDSRLQVSLYDVRAADDLVIGYDFDRDGWTIARSEYPDREVAFVRSWQDFEDEEKSKDTSWLAQRIKNIWRRLSRNAPISN